MPKCINAPRSTYTGKEPSPKGLGLCAKNEYMKVVRRGRDRKFWVIKRAKNKTKRWVRMSMLKSKKYISFNIDLVPEITINEFDKSDKDLYRGLITNIPDKVINAKVKKYINFMCGDIISDILYGLFLYNVKLFIKSFRLTKDNVLKYVVCFEYPDDVEEFRENLEGLIYNGPDTWAGGDIVLLNNRRIKKLRLGEQFKKNYWVDIYFAGEAHVSDGRAVRKK